jgi:hypothetical protein
MIEHFAADDDPGRGASLTEPVLRELRVRRGMAKPASLDQLLLRAADRRTRRGHQAG